MVSSLAMLGAVVGQVLLRLTNGAAEIAVARLVESHEEDERVAVLQVQEAVLLAGEARPQLAELGALDGAGVREGEPRPEELEPCDRLPHLRPMPRWQIGHEIEYRRSSLRRLVEPDLPSRIRRHRWRYNTLGIIPRALSACRCVRDRRRRELRPRLLSPA